MVTLKDRFLGCIAGSWIGSAMGAAVEGWTREKIAGTYGVLDRLVSYKHYTDVTDWQRPPGTTEDGIERQKLIATAIIEKRDRIRAEDLVAVWLRDLDPAKMVFKQERFDRTLLELARAGVPPSDLGRLCPFHDIISVARASHPLGLMNAGAPGAAADDSVEVGRLYVAETSSALRWAALYNAAIAEACRPGATVGSVLAVARSFAGYRAKSVGPYADYSGIAAEIDRALEIAVRHTDPAAMRDEFYRYYHGGDYVTYGHSQAGEIVSKGLAVFVLAGGDPARAVVAAVNFGRDTDCLAAVAGGLAGALAGASAIPPEWIAQVDEATRADQYTNSRRGIEETAEGLYAAFRARLCRLGEYVRTMTGSETATEEG